MLNCEMCGEHPEAAPRSRSPRTGYGRVARSLRFFEKVYTFVDEEAAVFVSESSGRVAVYYPAASPTCAAFLDFFRGKAGCEVSLRTANAGTSLYNVLAGDIERKTYLGPVQEAEIANLIGRARGTVMLLTSGRPEFEEFIEHIYGIYLDS